MILDYGCSRVVEPCWRCSYADRNRAAFSVQIGDGKHSWVFEGSTKNWNIYELLACIRCYIEDCVDEEWDWRDLDAEAARILSLLEKLEGASRMSTKIQVPILNLAGNIFGNSTPLADVEIPLLFGRCILRDIRYDPQTGQYSDTTGNSGVACDAYGCDLLLLPPPHKYRPM